MKPVHVKDYRTTCEYLCLFTHCDKYSILPCTQTQVKNMNECLKMCRKAQQVKLFTSEKKVASITNDNDETRL